VVMYMTKSEVSHIATVLDMSTIVHALPGRGVVFDSIDVLLVAKNRLLVGKRSVAESDQRVFAERMLSAVGARYDSSGVFAKGAAILIGRDFSCFRLSFVADVLITLVVLDLPSLLLLQQPVMLWLFPIYLAALVGGSLLGRLEPIVLETPASLMYRLMRAGSPLVGDGFLASQQRRQEPGLLAEIRRPMQKGAPD
jgi:hypothetical protein